MSFRCHRRGFSSSSDRLRPLLPPGLCRVAQRLMEVARSWSSMNAPSIYQSPKRGSLPISCEPPDGPLDGFSDESLCSDLYGDLEGAPLVLLTEPPYECIHERLYAGRHASWRRMNRVSEQYNQHAEARQWPRLCLARPRSQATQLCIQR